KDPDSVKVKDVMSKGVITIDEDKTLEDAVKAMKAHDIKKLPVMRSGKLVGIITTTDIITSMDKEFKEEGVTLDSYRDLKVLVRRHSINLKSETQNNQVLTFLIPNSLYPMDSISIIKAVSKAIPKLLYVTVNKPYFSLVETLKNKGVKTDEFYFIDASSGDTGTPKGKNFEKVSGQSDMTEIMVAIEKNLKTKRYSGVVFDSISTLLAYQNEEMVIRFAHSLINKLREMNVKGIFLCTKEDLKTNLMKNLNMLADYSVDIEKKGKII
ncbi:MAG: CBS domain-containing protein, partial [Thermoplasmata archaeon]|nr:CBS domain-containing protein [Thermoplasmata archaeon]